MFKVNKVIVDTLLLTLEISSTCRNWLRLSLINVKCLWFSVENFNAADLHIYFEKEV